MSNWLQSFRLTGDNDGSNNSFGHSCDLNDLGNIAIIGSRLGIVGGVQRGVAYIFSGNGNNWTKIIKISGSGIGNNQVANFGHSVSLNSAGNIAVIGSNTSDPNLVVDAGEVYVFTGSGNNWVQAAKITGSDAKVNDNFGHGLSINSIGNTIIAGSPYHSLITGAAYIFTGNESNWTQVAKITGNSTSAGDFPLNFGTSISINSIGDVALIGASSSFTNGLGCGAAYIFTGSGSNWVQTAKITGSDAGASDSFGYSVSLNSAGNVALVGAYLEDPNGVSDAGSAYIFTGSGSNWVQTAKITGSDAAGGDFFGISVSLNSAGNIALVGAYGDNNGTGSAYIFTGSGINWIQIQKITGGTEIMGFNTAINESGNIISVGALNEDAVYIFTDFVSSPASSSSSSSSISSSSSSYSITPSNFISSNYFQFNDSNNCHNLPTLITGIHVETGSFSLDLINLLSGFYNK